MSDQPGSASNPESRAYAAMKGKVVCFAWAVRPDDVHTARLLWVDRYSLGLLGISFPPVPASKTEVTVRKDALAWMTLHQPQ